MKQRILKIGCILLFFLLILSVTVVMAAEDSSVEDMLNDQYQASGADELPDELPDEVGDALSAGGVESPSPEQMDSFDMGGFCKDCSNQLLMS